MNKVFDNEVYEQQRKNIEALAAKNPDDWFYKSQMERPAFRRTGFAPVDRRCYRCRKDITEGERGITLEKLGSYIITGCPHCHASFCD
jgi:recombinational DNA repair protein (RecF pathway)